MSLLKVTSSDMPSRIDKEVMENPALEQEESKDSASPETDKEEPPLTDPQAEEQWKARYTTSRRGKRERQSMQEQIAPLPPFQEELQKQVALLALEGNEDLIAQHIIGSLTDEGYLPCSLEILKEEIAVIYAEEVTLDAIKKVLTKIRSIGPPSLAAQDLRESLLLQLKARPSSPLIQQATELIEVHFDAFCKKNYDKLAASLSIPKQELSKSLAVIKRLNPYPIIPTLPKASTSLLLPDFLVQTQNGKLITTLLDKKMPKLKISSKYRELLQKHKKEKSLESQKVIAFVQDHINRAKWFIQGIAQRKQTLLKIMKAIVDLQADFFMTNNPKKLKPVFLRNVAIYIGMDISTISRAIRHKAVQANGSVYPLKYFFSEPIKTEQGEEVSSHVIEEIMQEYIVEEDKRHPYTDEEITDFLQKKGYFLARRTVTKYRQRLGLPIARLRRELRPDSSK